MSGSVVRFLEFVLKMGSTPHCSERPFPGQESMRVEHFLLLLLETSYLVLSSGLLKVVQVK